MDFLSGSGGDMYRGRLTFNRTDDERAALRLHPIVNPTVGHLAMLPVGSEGALINFAKGERSIEAFVVDEKFFAHYQKILSEYSADEPLGHTVLLYILPEGMEGPLP